MLQKVRRILAAIFFVLLTLMLLDFTGVLDKLLGWMAKVQFLPAVLALDVVAVIAAACYFFIDKDEKLEKEHEDFLAKLRRKN